MTSITVDVSEAVRKLDPKTLERALADALDSAAKNVRTEARKYPPAPKPTYQWTYTLKRSWTVQKGRNFLERIIGTNVAYAPYVQDADRQAWMHKGRWQTTADIAQKKARDIQKVIETALQRWAR